MYEALGFDPDFIHHCLNVNLATISKRQPPRCSSKERAEVVKEEVNKLKQAGEIKAFYLEWLPNIVVVRKKLGKWRVCVDFTDLNKACPKDPFLVPQIDQLVDVTVGHPWMSF